MPIEKLQKFGMTDKEARVYVALLEIGDSVVTDVAKHAKVNRSTAYVLIDSLLHRGLISVSERRGIQIFSAVSPEKLFEIAKSKYNEANELIKISKDLANDLMKLKKSDATPSKTKVNVFEGKEGVKIVSQDLLMTKSPVRVIISDPNNKLGLLIKLPAKAKIILPESNTTRELLKQIKLLSTQEAFLASDISDEYSLAIHGNKVNFISPNEDKSFIIESQQFAKAIANLYELALYRAKRWNVKGEELEKPNLNTKNKVLAKAQNRFLGNL